MAKRTILKTWLVISIFLVVLGGAATVAGKTIYVDDDATGANNGSSWTDAYNYLQDALVDAETSEKPVEIRVAQGIYKPDHGSSIIPGDTNATFRLFNDVIIKGGYAGIKEHDPNICDDVLYETVLSGDLIGNDLPFEELDDIIIESSIADNSYRIVTANAVDNTILEGFTITGAIVSRYVVEVSKPEFEGAGLFISDNSSIIIRNCIFTKNATSGILCKNSNPTFINCTFKRNIKRGHGAGMCIRGSNISIKSCKFNENHAFAGGGIESSESMFLLEDCIFTQNVVHGCRCTIGGHGGALCFGDSLAGSRITECSFSNNIAIGGAGIFIGTYDRMPFGRGEEIQITGCTFTHNRASFGAAIDNYTNSIMIDNSSFIDNSAIISGGVVSNTFGTTSFSNCLLTGNSAGQRASVISAYGSCWPDGTLDHFFAIEFKNCTLVENIAPLGRTVACRSEGSVELDNIQISNCIISNGGNEIYNPDGSQIIINYTDFLGGASSIYDPCNAVIWGMGNIDADPLFADPGYWVHIEDPNVVVEPNDPNAVWIDGDYHLMSQAGRWDPNSESWVMDDITSPCIDAGDPNSPIGNEPSPNGSIINMGAYGGTVEASISPNYYSEFLESAVKMAGSTCGPGFRIVRFDATETPWPNFWPIKGLDSLQAVPYLINILENGPAWTDENLLKARGGIYPHIARCYAALCLGIIGDSRAFESLISVLQYGDYIEDEIEITYDRKDQYHISEYTALALGYLGDPNAVDPLIDTLQKDKREWAVFGLTVLRDVKAIKPIIEFASNNNRFDNRLHRCLEHISRASFRIKYSSSSRKYTIIDFPELGEFEGNKVHQALWEHWLVEGDEFAREQFEEYYPKWTLLIQERPDDQFSQDWAIFRMVRGGVPALPYVMDQIDKGDESLLPAVELIRKGKPVTGCSSRMPEENRIEMLLWWNENKDKWLIFDIQQPNNSGI